MVGGRVALGAAGAGVLVRPHNGNRHALSGRKNAA